MSDLQIEYRAPAQLVPRKRAWRKHLDKQIDLSAKALREYGAHVPILIDEDNRIVDGELILLAAKKIGLNRVPVIAIEGLNEAQMRKYGVLINRLSQLTEIDEGELGLELSDIAGLLDDPDLSDLGFEQAELDRLLGNTQVDEEEDEFEPVLQPGNPVAVLGDLWLLGEHRLLCGDALDPDLYPLLMQGELAQLGLSDVPYNVSGSSISGNGKHKHGDFVQASGELSGPEFIRFLTAGMRNMRDHSADGSLHMIFMSWHHLFELLRAGRIVFSELKNIVTWVKRSGGMGGFYRSQTEFVAVFKHGSASHINNIQLGRFGRNRTNAWLYDGMNSFGAERDELLALHPTVKPKQLIIDAILDASNSGGIVLDPFVGSGTTIIAAEDIDRRCYAMELDPLYVDVALRRYRAECDVDPILEKTGMTLSQIEENGRA